MGELHVFDFDGTLFRSPDKPDWWGRGSWVYDSVSLGPPCVPLKPGSAYWISPTVAAAKASISNPDVVSIVITGRGDKSFARYRVPELLQQAGLKFDGVYLATGDTASFKKAQMLKVLQRMGGASSVHIWEDHTTNLADFVRFIEKMGIPCIPHVVNVQQERATCTHDDVQPLIDDGWMKIRASRIADEWIQHIARLPTPESQQFAMDEADRAKHTKAATKAFKTLVPLLVPLADQAKAAFPERDKTSIQRRGRTFMKAVKLDPQMTAFLDEWIGTEQQNPKAKSWRAATIYQARDVLVYGKSQRSATEEVAKQADKGFQAITMAEAQGSYRDAIPVELREFMPKNIVVTVDGDGSIQKVTDRFENEHHTLGIKIEHMHDLVKRYNAIAKKVKKDLKSKDEITKLSALVTAILMETGIRPGKEGNGKVKTVNGEDVFVETFGAITLGPTHVRFVRQNFVQLEFVGKMTTTNMADVADAGIIKMLQAYVDQALKNGTKYIFVTARGVRFTYTDLQRYFRLNFAGLNPTDFRKLKATETVLGALRDEQATLMTRIKGFAKLKADDLKQAIVGAVVEAFERAIARSQKALSHEKSDVTVRQYINPEIIFRFLSTGRVDSDLKTAILTGRTQLAFDPETFLAMAKGKKASWQIRFADRKVRQASLGELIFELEKDLNDAGVRMATDASRRVASRWVTGAGTADDITRNLPAFQSAYNDMVDAIIWAEGTGLSGSHMLTRKRANIPWLRLIENGYKIANGILSTRSIPPRQAKGLEMSYRLFANSRMMPKDIFKWWAKNQKRLLLIITAANKWPEKKEGGDELFKIGSFRVHNTVGATGPELASLKKAIKMAEKMAKRNPVPGFTKAVYGDIHVVSRITKGHHAAWYHPGDDSLYLRRSKATGMDEAQSLVHELGHRWWLKSASTSAKQAWLKHHWAVEGKKVDVDLPKVGDSLQGFHIPGVKADPVVTKDDGATFFFDVIKKGVPTTYTMSHYKMFKAMERHTKAAESFPTAYSATSAEEHFCESLKLLAAGALPDEHAIPFKAIWH